MVVEDEVDDAEQHHREYNSRARAVKDPFTARQCAADACPSVVRFQSRALKLQR